LLIKLKFELFTQNSASLKEKTSKNYVLNHGYFHKKNRHNIPIFSKITFPMPRMSGLQFIFAYKKKKEVVIRMIDNDFDHVALEDARTFIAKL